MAESALKPYQKQLPKYAGGPPGPGRGIAQWEVGGRWDTNKINFLKYERQRRFPSAFVAELNFAAYELKTDYSNVRKELIALPKRGLSGLARATDIVMRDYEAAGVKRNKARQDDARAVYDLFNVG